MTTPQRQREKRKEQRRKFELYCDKVAVQCVSILAEHTKVYAYEGVQSAREIRALLIRKFGKRVRP